MNFYKRIRTRIAGRLGMSLLAGLVAAILPTGEAVAQEGKIVKAIDVQYVGSQTVAPERILSSMSTRVGDKLSLAQIDEDVKSLYSSGNVENVRILSENASGGVRLIVVAQTRAVYGGSEFTGNTLIDDSKLAKKVELTVNKPIDESALQTARQEMQELYRKKGFSAATITYRIGAPTAQGYSKVLFTVNEGTQGVLRDVEFVGNNSFSSARLKEQMTQKEKSIKTIFSKGGSTDAETLAQDVRAIEDFYRDNGFLNAKVTNVSRMRADAKYVDVVMTIDEGATYRVDSLAVTGVQSLSMQDDIVPFLKTKAGETFAGNKLKSDIDLIEEQYGRQGYADARVIPDLEDAGDGAVRVLLNVSEGSKYKVGQIQIEGNDKTQDHVIRRELPLEPGQDYDVTRIDVTERRLQNMNYFESVEVIPSPSGSYEFKDLRIRVVEKPTGTVNFGAGFSSIDSVTGFFEVTQTNFDLFDWPSFSGAGQRFRLSLRGGNERKDASISITEPWFMGQRLALTGEAYYRDLLFLSDSFDQTEYGGAISLRKSLGEFTYGTVEYRGERVEIDAEPGADPAFFQDGKFFKSSVGVSITRDTRDNVFLPRKGHKVSAGFEFAGLGGDINDTIITVSGAQYFKLPYDGIFSVNGRFLNSSDGDQLFTRHYLGGANNLRGYDFRDVGPRSPGGNGFASEVVGGKRAWNATAEVSYPIVEKIRGAAFYDVGEVSGGPVGSVGGGMHSDWGLGLRLFILGSAPVRLDYAFPLQNDGFNDDGGRFQFTMGAQF